MKLILVRHGDYFEDSLTIKGVKQAVEVGAKLAGEKIDAIYCSPTKRCEQTMDEILRIRNDDFPVHFSKLIGPKLKSESLSKLKARIELFIDDLKYDHQDGDTIVMISHAFAIEMAIFQISKDRKVLEHGELFEVVL